MLDAATSITYLVARMKRLLALFALVFGMAALAVPAHARVSASAECSQTTGQQSAASQRVDRHGEPVTARRRQQRDRELGKPDVGKIHTVILPTVMLVDRPLE